MMSPRRFRASRVETYVCDDGVTVVLGHKVLDLARRGIRQAVAADKVRSNAVLLSV